MQLFNGPQKKQNILNAGARGKDSFGKPFENKNTEKLVLDIVSELKQVVMWGPNGLKQEILFSSAKIEDVRNGFASRSIKIIKETELTKDERWRHTDDRRNVYRTALEPDGKLNTYKETKPGMSAYHRLNMINWGMTRMSEEAQMALARTLTIVYACFPEEMKLLEKMDTSISFGRWKPPEKTKEIVLFQREEVQRFFEKYLSACEDLENKIPDSKKVAEFINFAFGREGNRDFEYPVAYYLAKHKETGAYIRQILADEEISEMTARLGVVSLAKDVDFTEMRKALEVANKSRHPLLGAMVDQFYEQFPIVKKLIAHVPVRTTSPESERVKLEYIKTKGIVKFRIQDMENRNPTLLLKALRQCEQLDLRFNWIHN